MKPLVPSILFTTLTLFASCLDRRNILVKGQITDSISGQPVPNAEVVVLCWYMSNIDDASFKKQSLKTDNSGNYEVAFDKGHKIDVASKARDYQPNRSYNDLIDNQIEVNLKLSKSKNNQTLLTLLNTATIITDTTNKAPFLRIRIHKGKIVTYGFDVATMTTTADTAQCDFWFKIVKGQKQPTTIASNKNGGIIPIYTNEIRSSLLYENITAPTTGYRREYSLKGNEEELFVLCRDGKTYAKIILEKSAIDTSSPDGQGGYYNEFGKRFSCLYQPNGTSDLSYPHSDISLEDFLVDFRMR